MSDQSVIDGLNDLVSDATVFYFKLHNYHWNIRGRQFFTLHEQFERLYTEWAGVLDELAERVLSLGGKPIPNLRTAIEHAAIKEEDGSPKTADMVRSVLTDLQTSRDRMKAVSELAQKADDKTTENILDDFIDATAKHVWMYGAWLDKTVDED